MVLNFSLGVAIGLILALTGAGGGILAVPLLVCIGGLSVIEAAPIGLFAVGMAAAFGAALGLKAGKVRYRAALFMAFTGMLASPFGLLLAGKLDNVWLGTLFAFVLLLLSGRYFFEKENAFVADNVASGPPCRLSLQSGRLVWTSRCARSLAASGATTGFLSGLIGVGGGFVIVPALKRFTNLTMYSIVPTSLATVAIVSMSGAVAGAIAGNVVWETAMPFSMGAPLGVIGAQRFVRGLSERRMKKLFAVAAAVAALALLIKTFSSP